MEQCPICNKRFPVQNIEAHVNDCVQAAFSAPAPASASAPAASSSASNAAQAMPSQHPSFTSSSSSSALPAAALPPYQSIHELTQDVQNFEQITATIFQKCAAMNTTTRMNILPPSQAVPLYQRLLQCAHHISQVMDGLSHQPDGAFLDTNKSVSSSSQGSSFPSSSSSSSSSSSFYNDHHSVTAGNEEQHFQELLRQINSCSICKSALGEQNLLVLDCDHRFCASCLKEELHERLSGEKKAGTHCPASGCDANIRYRMLQQVLTEQEIAQLETMGLNMVLKSNGDMFAQCPKCSIVFEKVASQNQHRDVNETGLDGKPLSADAVAHRNKFRFRCPTCSINFCSGCAEEPYHLGYTCESFLAYKNAKHCRFCAEPLTAANTSRGGGAGLSGQVCTGEDCQEKKAHSCNKVLPCGHVCCGIKGESECLPCLETDCPSKDPKCDKDEYCGICYTEGLGAAPCIKLKCSHVFHKACVLQKITKKWPGSRITFGFLNCPLCKVVMEHSSLEAQLAPLLQLRDDIRGKAQQRLAVEGMSNDPQVVDPNSPYYKQPVEYAMAKFAYYPCFKCNLPYFGGQRRCEEANQENAETFDASHLVCGSCADNGSGECKKHGKDFIEWKCKFCCNISSWFCWGTTHFCKSCHDKQVAGDYVTKKPISALPKCPGAKECPFQGKHPEAGSEWCAGCALCRYSGNF